MDSESLLQWDTLDGGNATVQRSLSPVPLLTILGHPDPGRVGDTCWLAALDEPRSRVELNRAAPEFVSPSGGRGRPLLSPFVSRRPVSLSHTASGVLALDPGELAGRVAVDGDKLTSRVSFPPERLDEGVVIRLGTHVVLLWHREVPPVGARASNDLGLVGETASIRELRAEILRLARAPGAVLLGGETGTGKELVAAALHQASERAGRPYVVVNMAAIPASLAASELFGHRRGAFSGASEAHDGFFVRADRGTLFLDEIGDTPDDVQAALLRVLETGEVQAVGARTVREVDVRLIAATDADLEGAIQSGRFRAPLFYRLSANQLHLPPLRQRRADIGRLLLYFLKQELASLGRADLLTPEATERDVWLSAGVVDRLARYDWPGNVRQLRNVARYLAGRSSSGGPLRKDDPGLTRLLGDAPTPPGTAPRGSAPGSTPGGVSTADPDLDHRNLSDDDLLRLMEAVDFKLGDAAKRLGISRPTINGLVDAHPTLKRPKFLTDEEIEAARAQSTDTGQPLWRILRVSARGLGRRLSGVDKA